MSKAEKLAGTTVQPFSDEEKEWLFFAPMYYDFASPQDWQLDDNYFDPRITEQAIRAYYYGEADEGNYTESGQVAGDTSENAAVTPPTKISAETIRSVSKAFQTPNKSSNKKFSSAVKHMISTQKQQATASDTTAPVAIVLTGTTCATPSTKIEVAAPHSTVNADAMQDITAAETQSPVEDHTLTIYANAPVYVPIQTPEGAVSPTRPVIVEPVAEHPTTSPRQQTIDECNVTAYASSPVNDLIASLDAVALSSSSPTGEVAAFASDADIATIMTPKLPTLSSALSTPGAATANSKRLALGLSAFKALSPFAQEGAIATVQVEYIRTPQPAHLRSPPTTTGQSKRKVTTFTPFSPTQAALRRLSAMVSSPLFVEMPVATEVQPVEPAAPQPGHAVAASILQAASPQNCSDQVVDSTPGAHGEAAATPVDVASTSLHTSMTLSAKPDSAPARDGPHASHDAERKAPHGQVIQSTKNNLLHRHKFAVSAVQTSAKSVPTAPKPSRFLAAQQPRDVQQETTKLGEQREAAHVAQPMSVAPPAVPVQVNKREAPVITKPVGAVRQESINPTVSTPSKAVARANRFRSVTAKFVQKMAVAPMVGCTDGGEKKGTLKPQAAASDQLPRPAVRARRVSIDESHHALSRPATAIQPIAHPASPKVAAPALVTKAFVAAAEMITKFEHGDLLREPSKARDEKPKPTTVAPFHLHTEDRAHVRGRRVSASFLECQPAESLKHALSSSVPSIKEESSAEPTGFLTAGGAGLPRVPKRMVTKPMSPSFQRASSVARERIRSVEPSAALPRRAPRSQSVEPVVKKVADSTGTPLISAFQEDTVPSHPRRASYTIVKPFKLATDERAKLHSIAHGADSDVPAPSPRKVASKAENHVPTTSAVPTFHTAAASNFRAKALAAFRSKAAQGTGKPLVTVASSPALATKSRSEHRSSSVTRSNSALRQ